MQEIWTGKNTLTIMSTPDVVTARNFTQPKKIGHNTYLLIVKLGNTIKVLLKDIR